MPKAGQVGDVAKTACHAALVCSDFELDKHCLCRSLTAYWRVLNIASSRIGNKNALQVACRRRLHVSRGRRMRESEDVQAKVTSVNRIERLISSLRVAAEAARGGTMGIERLTSSLSIAGGSVKTMPASRIERLTSSSRRFNPETYE
jgi:hypothetical protein